MIQGNSLIAIVPPAWFKPKILASLTNVDQTIETVIECESSGNPNAYNPKDPNGGSFGLLQFQLDTFQEFCVEKFGLEDDIWSEKIQRECASKMIDEGRVERWSCSREI